MSNRDLGNTILFNTLLDNLPTDPVMTPICDQVLKPEVVVTLPDCNTNIGKIYQADYSLIGLIDLKTGLPLTQDSINGYVSKGTYEIKTRSVDTCTARGGICQKCLQSSYPALPNTVGSKVRIDTSSKFSYIQWFAGTYSGSMFGMAQDQFAYLPVREDLIRDTLTNHQLEIILSKISDMQYMSDQYISYFETIKDPLEKALYGILVWATYSSIS